MKRTESDEAVIQALTLSSSNLSALVVDLRAKHAACMAADDKIAQWLSAALDDPNVCAEFKLAINEWFRARGEKE